MSTISNEINPNWPTLYEIGKNILDIDLSNDPARKADPIHANMGSVVDTLQQKPFPINEGTFVVSPSEISSLKVPLLERDEKTGHLVGFQREHSQLHARRMARAFLDGKEMPTVKVSILPDGQPYVTDGMHTSLGAIISRHPVEVTVKRRTVEQARELFNNQRLAKQISKDQIILSGSSPLEFYIQDAATSNTHVWSPYVGMGAVQGGTGRKMSPTTAVVVVGQFAYNTFNRKVEAIVNRDEPFNQERADKMAHLLSAFGTKQTNEFAFRAAPLKAISAAATHIFLRNPHARATDEERWMKHMGTFDFSKYAHLLSRGGTELTMKLIEHWNKRLGAEHKLVIAASEGTE